MPTTNDVKRILDEHADELTSLPNVVAVGLVPTDDESTDAVAVYVSSKVPEPQLKQSEIVPRRLTSIIGGVKVGVPTRVVEVGKITH